MKHLLLLSNHLNQAYIKHINPDQTTVALTKQQFTYFNYHHYRIIYHISASKHFAQEHNLTYTYEDTWESLFNRLPKTDTYYMYKPNDLWMKKQIEEAVAQRDINVEWYDDINFFHIDIINEIGESPYKLDPLYKKWRKEFEILMENKKPIGQSFSFDQDNRQRPPKSLSIDAPLKFKADALTKDVISYVKDTFKTHPKSTKPFVYPVTKTQANEALTHFIKHRLVQFGQYQDAMMTNEPFMVHSLLSTVINLGLLLAKDVVQQIEQAYHKDNAPIEAVEGFIRQILGWREYVRGIYLKEMTDDYHKNNYLNHTHQKPSFLYSGMTDMNCLHKTLHETIDNGYNHHIQRLMIIGNITNLLQIDPKHIRTWFNEMYIDSFDWIVTPNVIGMAHYADGGLMSTKPYISSANYINKMSNYCSKCSYNYKEKIGDNACPINALYYNFLDVHKKQLSKNPRMKFMYMNYNKLSEEVLEKMTSYANYIIKETPK